MAAKMIMSNDIIAELLPIVIDDEDYLKKFHLQKLTIVLEAGMPVVVIEQKEVVDNAP